MNGSMTALPRRCPDPMNRMTARLPPNGLFRVICLTAGLVALTGDAASACSVPVFRYALERFQADSYHFTVYYRGALTGPAKAAVDALQQLCNDSGPAANFDLQTVDLDALPRPAAKGGEKPASKSTTSPRAGGLPHASAKDGEQPGETAKPAWTPPKTAKLPWLAVTLPGDDAAPLWSAPLEIQDLPRLIDSPARRQIVKRLLGGESAVFVLLESGRKEDDAKTTKLLTTTIAKMQKDLALPADDGTGKPRSDLPLRIAFSVLAIRRDDPAEALLVKTIESALEQSNAKNKDTVEPIVCPIFGRGRILGTVAGKDVTGETIESAGQFLCGACACTLKGELTGTDLLLMADWDALLDNRVVHDDPPALRSLGALAEAARAAATPPAAAGPIAQAVSPPREPQAGPATIATGTGGLLRVVAETLAALVGVVLIAAGVMRIAMRRKRPA